MTTLTPYYSDGMTAIFHGDCMDVLPRLGQFDLIFTSPPYNLGTNPNGQFGHWKDGDNSGGRAGTRKWAATPHGAGIDYDLHADGMPAARYQAWQQSVLAECWERLTDTGAIYYNHKPRVQKNGLWLPLSLNPGLPVRQIITWARAGGFNYTTTAYVPTYEWIVVLAKPGFRLKAKGASGAGDVWRVPQDTGNPHPASFPVDLPARGIESVGPGSVLDPFVGSGTTLVAATLAGVPSVGIEASEAYCEMAAKRLSKVRTQEEAS